MKNTDNDLAHYDAIVVDIGGTNTRFAWINLLDMQLQDIRVYYSADFDCLEAMLRAYQQEHHLHHIIHAAIALAGPVNGDTLALTNLSKTFSFSHLRQHCGFNTLELINDFVAIALSLGYIESQDGVLIGAAQPQKGAKVVLGPGTGLGVACLLPDTNGSQVVSSEAGHINWAAQNEQEWFIQQFLSRQYAHLSAERLLSGAGLVNIDKALSVYLHLPSKPRTAADISSLALAGQCELAIKTVEQFCASLGSFAGDMALAFNAFGGVYLAGGIMPRLLSCLQHSAFRQRFNAKGRFSAVNEAIATVLLTHPQPGLLGAAVRLREKLALKQKITIHGEVYAD